MAGIHFFSEDTPFKLEQPRKIMRWIRTCIHREDQVAGDLNFIFCSDEFLYNINKEYLNHDTYTDIITFDLSENSGFISGEIYVSIDRVKENAAKLKVDFNDELHRVIIHGILHLLGHSDKGPRKKALMRKKEDAYLSLRK